MAKAIRRTDQYDSVLTGVVSLLEAARRASARAVNTVMAATYWEIGRRIVEWEMSGAGRADYGEELVCRLADDLTRRFGRGSGRSNLYQMRAFYMVYRDIVQMPSGQSAHTIEGRSAAQGRPGVVLDRRFPLPWSHYVRLLSIKDAGARGFYETEALRGGWTVKQLDRQINSMFYEQTALSRNKALMLTKGQRSVVADAVSAEEEIKDPFVLEFLGLKDEYSESDLEEALVQQLEAFLLELGGDFAFIGRQRRLRIGDTWYRVDLLFFHRRLRCLVIIDLKIGRFTHADAGQMHLYCNYAAEHWTQDGENPPVGLVLCSQHDSAVAHYALGDLNNRVLAAEYRMRLPDERMLARELEKTRRRLESARRVRERR